MNTYELDPITPGEILFEEFLQPSNINQSTLATKIGVPANRISQIIHGKREISPDTALRLGKFFGIEPEFWLNLQMNYDLKLTKKQIYPQILAIQAMSNDYRTNT
ncbi:putative HTH-type transcriptional regulator YbaQ [Candidatus Arcanobacter lacustris]|uniref:Putative HTH-type transcriptional regulator YbaQ n=1 Tax=Candidatus Arcanibacter lacustris TaxID=1607817 RepID=A0A0F5MPR5_9RICK|nr:putative HTH-type transcriptional regulator YbaQ [Candidatus Arcanobacter lacustris]